jgi:hypothetical protein
MTTDGQKPPYYTEIRNAYAQQTTDASRQACLRSQNGPRHADRLAMRGGDYRQ